MILAPQQQQQPPTPSRDWIKPQPGVGSLLTLSPFGFVYSGAPGGGRSFAHPWQPSLVGRDGVRLSKGVVYADGLAAGYEPLLTEGGRALPVSGDASKRIPAPTLRLDRAVATAALESWVCLEVTPDKDGKLADSKGALLPGVKIEVVHRNAPSLSGQPTGRHPLALIAWGKDAPARIWPVTFFHLRYHRTTPPAGQGAPRHLFY